MTTVKLLAGLILLALACPSLSKRCSGIGDIIFMLDSSTSVGPVNLNKVKHFVSETVALMRIDPNHVRVAAVVFNTYPRTAFTFNIHKYKAGLLQAIKGIRFTEGLTFLGEAFRYVRKNFKGEFRKDVPKLIVLISDGKSNGDLSDIKEARKLKATGIDIITVGVTPNIDRKDMRQISSKNKLFLVKNINSLKNILRQVSSTACKSLKPEPKRHPCFGFPVDLLFVLDSSTSVGDKNWKKQQRFLIDLIKPFKISRKASRVGLITYNTMVNIAFNIGVINSYKGIKNAVMKTKFTEGATFTGQALNTALRRSIKPRFRKGNIARVVILITDGRSNGWTNPVSVAKKIKLQGVHLLTVGITNQVNRKQLKQISSNNHVYTAKTFDNLRSLVHSIVRKTCTYSKNANPKKVAVKKEKKKEKKEKKKREKKKKRKKGKKTLTRCKKQKIDAVFVLDSSSSVGPYNWKEELKFLISLTKPLDVDSGRARVALVTYNTFVRLRFGLKKYKTMKSLRNAIKNTKFTEGLTFTGEALQKVLLKIAPTFRKGVKKLVFLITDGRTNGYLKPVKVAAKLKKLGVHIITVGITKQINKRELKKISSSGVVYKVNVQKLLKKIVPAVSNDMCKK